MASRSFPDHYAALESPFSATRAELLQSWKSLCLKYHPDKNPAMTGKEPYRLMAVNEAWNVLKDESKRSDYDKQYRTRFPGKFRPPPKATWPPPPNAARPPPPPPPPPPRPPWPPPPPKPAWPPGPRAIPTGFFHGIAFYSTRPKEGHPGEYKEYDRLWVHQAHYSRYEDLRKSQARLAQEAAAEEEQREKASQGKEGWEPYQRERARQEEEEREGRMRRARARHEQAVEECKVRDSQDDDRIT